MAEDGPAKAFKKRSCTDILCLLAFFALLAVLGAICIIGLMTGDYTEYLYEADYLGNRCGVGPMAGKSKAFYPRIPRDMLEKENRKIIEAGDYQQFSKLKLYALCVEKCPSKFNINSPEKALVEDYGYDKTTATTQALGSGTQALWLSATPTLDIMNRCIPREEVKMAQIEMCAYPKCDTSGASDLGAGVSCADSTVFPNMVSGEWQICPPGTSKANCKKQTDLCKVMATETTTTSYALHADDEASKAMMAGIAKQVGGVYEIVSATIKQWVIIIIGGIATPVALAFCYMFLLYLFAKTIIYGLLFLLIICELTATFICFARSGMSFKGVDAQSLIDRASDMSNVSAPSATAEALAAVDEESTWMYSLGFLLLGVISVMTIILVITSRKKIAICAAIIKESSKVFKSMPSLMIFPAFSTALQILCCVWFVGTMMLIYTSKPQSIDTALSIVADETSADFKALGSVTKAPPNVDPIGGIRAFMADDGATRTLTAIVLFGFFVIVQFVQGAAWCTMSGAVYYWYYFQNDAKEHSKAPITKSLGRSLFYHSGSIAFSAFVLAICDMMRAVAAYLEKQMGPTNNFMVKLAFKVLQCCLACLKKTVKFISSYGLIFVSCQGTSFCAGCFRTFFFFMQNPGQVAINALVVKLLKLTSIFSMPLGCAVVFFYYLDSILEAPHPVYPALIIFVCAAIMTVSCMTVFECTVTTIFVACFQDKAEFGGKFMATDHKILATALGIKKKSADDEKPAEGTKQVV